MEKRGVKRKHVVPFKSPLPSAPTGRVAKSDGQVIEELQKKLDDANKQIHDLEELGMKEEELKTHIDKLHEYNEIKDVGQIVLGRLANLQQVRTKDLYEQYGLNLED